MVFFSAQANAGSFVGKLVTSAYGACRNEVVSRYKIIESSADGSVTVTVDLRGASGRLRPLGRWPYARLRDLALAEDTKGSGHRFDLVKRQADLVGGFLPKRA